jgi:AIG2-like family
MLPETMTVLRDVTPLSSFPAVLYDYELQFRLRGVPFIEPSAANVDHCLGSQVHGVLYELSERDFAKVGSTEGVNLSYRWQGCHVVPYDDEYRQQQQQESDPYNNIDAKPIKANEVSQSNRVKAYTLVALSPTPTNIPPSKSYLGVLIEGGRVWKLDQDYQQFLESIPCATNLIVNDGLARFALNFAKARKQFSTSC